MLLGMATASGSLAGCGFYPPFRPELEPLRLADRRAFDAAKQFVGWAVGRIMRDHGHKTVGRSRVPGGLFTVGAIWSGEPQVYSARRRAALKAAKELLLEFERDSGATIFHNETSAWTHRIELGANLDWLAVPVLDGV